MKNDSTETKPTPDSTQQLARRRLQPAVRTHVKAGLIICRARG